jgi:hypothetical protein
MVGYRPAQDYIAVKLVDHTAINLVGSEMHLVGWPLTD